MRPGPRWTDILNAQREHRSTAVWEAGYNVNNVLTCRRVEKSLKGLASDPRMDVYLRQAGFYGVVKLPFISLD
ncbi:hypothetical protein MLD38_034089 [Melastoma candidum]|uniref:Uncharacterized protein n=1 Tax=Melastoma candidum TaxID=119954 RepID=A0ACB9M9F0_9MYRT|nr:hypothetical protein MLD38_034089 [Melastoma candidum]